MSRQKRCSFFGCCKKKAGPIVNTTVPAEPVNPVVRVDVVPAGHHKYTSTLVDIRDALKTPSMGK